MLDRINATPIEHASREEWHQTRFDGVGGSEAPSLYGKGFEGEFCVWERKVSREVDDETNDKLEAGRVLEPGIRQILANKYHLTVHSIGEFTVLRSKECPDAQATLDGIVEPWPDDEVEGPGIFEIKNTTDWAGWKKPHDSSVFGAGEMPLRVELQVQHNLAVTGMSWGAVGVLLSGWKPALFRRTRRLDFAGFHFPRVEEFMRRVREQDPPEVDDSEATTEALRRHFNGVNDDTITLPHEAADWIVAAKEADAQRDLYAPRATLARNRLRLAMGDHTVAIVLGFDKPITNKPTKAGTRTLRLPSQ